MFTLVLENGEEDITRIAAANDDTEIGPALGKDWFGDALVACTPDILSD
jgi:hypothetical protein